MKRSVLVFAAFAAAILGSACSGLDDTDPSDIPWSRPDAGFEGARSGNFPQSR